MLQEEGGRGGQLQWRPGQDQHVPGRGAWALPPSEEVGRWLPRGVGRSRSGRC